MRYLILINTEETDTAAEADLTRMSAAYDAYGAWLEQEGILRGGERLAPAVTATTVRVRDGRRIVSDGPFAETKEVLGGFFLIECDDLDRAIDAAARCPGAADGVVEVRPLVEMQRPAAAGATADHAG